jgi:putative tryptophan/tyrosine transport system substrate-binding protein
VDRRPQHPNHLSLGALDDAESRQRSAKELIALQPDLILTQNTPPTASMLQQTRTIPVIFVVVADPVGSRFVESLARPGGNVTGFTIMEPTISGKLLELLKEIAPHVNRAAFLFNPKTAPYVKYYLDPFDAAAASLGLEAFAAPVNDRSEIETIIAAQSRESNSGLVVIPDGFLNVHRAEIVLLTAHYRLPCIRGVSSLNLAACCPTVVSSAICFGLPQLMSIASSGARSRLTFQCRHRPNTSW